jgi:hypothetical protein
MSRSHRRGAERLLGPADHFGERLLHPSLRATGEIHLHVLRGTHTERQRPHNKISAHWHRWSGSSSSTQMVVREGSGRRRLPHHSVAFDWGEPSVATVGITGDNEDSLSRHPHPDCARSIPHTPQIPQAPSSGQGPVIDVYI